MQKRTMTTKITDWWRRWASRLLATSWVLGILMGCGAAKSASSVLTVLLRGCVTADMTLWGIVSVTMLPFLLSAFAVSFSEPWLLLFISTFKAFSFSFCAWGVCLAFGHSSWLVLFLLLFSDFLLIPLLVFYWLRHIRGDILSPPWELPLFLGIALGVGYIDYRYIAPFLASLMK